MKQSTYTREELISEIADAEAISSECDQYGIDNTYYEDHLSFLRRELYQMANKSQQLA